MTEQRIQNPFALEALEVAKRLETDLHHGLDDEEVKQRQQLHGSNRLKKQATKSLWSILVHQFHSIIVWLLAVAAAFSIAIGDEAEGAAIFMVLIINAAIGFFTERRAAKSMEALLRIAEVRTRVRRDGIVRMVDAQDLVPGEIVMLYAGDVVTADLRLTETSNLKIDESVLTGESMPVRKQTAAIDAGTMVGDCTNMAFKGTAITQGTGEGIVVAIGMNTEIGRISELAQKAEADIPPLERRLDRLGHRLVWLAFGLAILTVGIGFMRGHPLTDMIQTGVALAIAAVPEGLPVVATLSLARGMWRMASRNALINNLSSVETLGATTIILTDKTGTLTENRMTVMRYLLAGRDVDVEPLDKPLQFQIDGVEADRADDNALDWAVKIGALCNNAELGDGSDGAQSGDPMEIALLTVDQAEGLGRHSLRDQYDRVGQYAFDPDRKMMATVHRGRKGYLYSVKGAPEAVIAACQNVLTDGGTRELDCQARKAWNDRNSQTAATGLRLLALAMKQCGPDNADPYKDLTLIGLVGFVDPLREDVPAAIADSLNAGVRVVMLTGDHADTAKRIARDAGLGHDDLTVISGAELRQIDLGSPDSEEEQRILSTDVFARVSPEAKLLLAALYQKKGHVVAMTGDGVNDAPALKKADIGIAMGQRGTQVAREAADMVLKDDAFSTIIVAMHQGRVIFDNIRKFVVYLLSCNVSEVLVVAVAVGAGLPVPLLPLQILFLNLITDVFPAFALGFGPGDDSIMRQPPRDPSEPVVDRPRWMFIGLLGGVITAATLVAFALALFWLKLDPAPAITVAFLTLALAQLWNVFNMRMPGSGLLINEVTRNRYVWGALVLCSVLIGLAVWLPWLSNLLGLPSPGTQGLALAVGMSFVPLLIGQLILATPLVAHAGSAAHRPSA
nr:cation-transporting P-type ATPase [uncultured Hoeflea sp.]